MNVHAEKSHFWSFRNTVLKGINQCRLPLYRIGTPIAVQSQSQRSCSAARSKRSLITKSPIRIGLNYSYFSAFPDRLSQHDNARKLLLKRAVSYIRSGILQWLHKGIFTTEEIIEHVKTDKMLEIGIFNEELIELAQKGKLIDDNALREILKRKIEALVEGKIARRRVNSSLRITRTKVHSRGRKLYKVDVGV